MTSDNTNTSVQPTHLANQQYSAANPYMQNGYGMSGYGMSNVSPMSSYSPYSSYGGGMGSYMGGYGGYNHALMGDNMWQGFLGQTAESLGRINNFLSMTGMLVEHVSNHSKLLYGKGVEFHTWYQGMKEWSEKHSEWFERLGFQIEAGWKTNESEEIRKRRMLIRRVRTILLAGILLSVVLLMRRKKRASRRRSWDQIYTGR